MADTTPTNTPTPSEPTVDILKMIGSQKTMSLNKLYNLHQGIVPEIKEDAGSELGATTETPKSA